MLHTIKTAFTILSVFSLLLISSNLFSQPNTFKLGITGAYPNDYNYGVFSTVDWDYYTELKMNTWQGWWIGDNAEGYVVIDNLELKSMFGYFQPDSLRWAAYGRVQINEAEQNGSLPFRYDEHRCGTNYEDNTSFGSGQLVRYFNSSSSCNEIEAPGGLVLWDVYENGFQSFSGVPNDPKKQVIFPDDGSGGDGYINRYYIKPRMRISTTDAFGTLKNVIKIIVQDYDGYFLDEIIINTEDFRYNNSSTYDGRYLEHYFNNNMVVDGDDINATRSKNDPALIGSCNVDYQIYWYGEVSVWIDYVKVMDEAANLLFNNELDSMIAGKIRRLDNNDPNDRILGMYMEEVDYSNLHCLQKMNEKLRYYSGNDPRFEMTALINPESYQAHLRNWEYDRYEEYLDVVEPPALMLVRYNAVGDLDSDLPIPENVTIAAPPSYPGGVAAEIEDIYTLATVGNDASYRAWLEYTSLAQVSSDLKHLGGLSQSKNIPFYFVPQFIFWHMKTSDFWMREPMTSEIDAAIGIALCRGAKGILPYSYESGHNTNSGTRFTGGTGKQYIDNNNTSYTYNISAGLSDFGGSDPWGKYKRTQDFYGANKWDSVKELYAKMERWGPILFNSTNTTGYWVADDGANHHYINDIKSIYRDSSPPYAYNNEDTGKYWEMGFIDNGEASTKYLMMVNRRCIPETSPGTGELRELKIKFNGAGLPPHFVTWKAIDVYTKQTVLVFDRNSTAYHSFGVFNPGESKLYKLVPVMKHGGEIAANENISGQTFTCEDTVISNGFNITIDSGSTVSFTDSAAIIMTGGTFQSGIHGQNQLTTYKGAGSSKWPGLSFTNTEVKIYNSKFQDISSPAVNYAVKMHNCPLADIRTNQFVMSTDTSGAVRSVYVYTALPITYLGMYFNFNSVTMNSSRAPAVTCQGFSGLTMPVSVMNNTMSSSGYATGVMLSGITSAGVKKNNITGFSTGINLLSTTADIFGNTISNTTSESKGITVYSASTLNLAPAGSSYTGGFNVITNTYGSSINIELDNSMILLEQGNNTFDINSSASPQAYHLYGTLYSGSNPNKIMGNCYKLSGTPITDPDPPYENLMDEGNDPLGIDFMSYLCDPELPEGEGIADLGNGVYDTIPGSSEGMGGSISSEQLTINNKKAKAGSDLGFRNSNLKFTLSPAKLFDSVNINMSRRDYSSAKTFCYELIETYPDSFQSVSSLQSLYLCVTATDTTYSGRSGLKTFYETLILEHGSNTSLVKACNYLAQKCKVLLGQYSSAMTGFQQIVTNNPYSYEGLLARWDYMATSLLVPSGGSYSSMFNEQLSMNNLKSDESYEFDESFESDYGDDKNPFSKDEKKQIYTSVKTAFETAKNDDDRKIKTLEDNSKKGDVNSTKQLQQMQTLKQIVKTEKPKTIIEHIKIVGSDMQKVFGNTSPVVESKGSVIPNEFSLGQNYPNPFNPMTTIKYALPHDAKVVIKIYDILGREVKMLINQVQQAGYYDVKFDGSVYASGVYFYRIEVRQAGSTTDEFVQSRKMVLVK